MWFIAYQHSIRPDEAGIKFVLSEALVAAERQRLESTGYVITNVAPTSQTRMKAFLADSLSDPEQPLLSKPNQN